MDIKIIKETNWYSAKIQDYRIVTQWDTFEDLIVNLNESLSLYNEWNKLKNFSNIKEFSLVI